HVTEFPMVTEAGVQVTVVAVVSGIAEALDAIRPKAKNTEASVIIRKRFIVIEPIHRVAGRPSQSQIPYYTSGRYPTRLRQYLGAPRARRRQNSAEMPQPSSMLPFGLRRR